MSETCISTDAPCQTVPKFSQRSAQILFAGQAKLLAARAEAGLPIDVRSLLNLVRAYRNLVVGEARR
jgi:hypothetical protein